MSVPILNRRDIVHLLKDPVKMFYILVSDRFRNAFYCSTAALEHCTCLFHSDLLKNIPESQSGFLFNIFREIRFGKEKLF